MLRCAALFLLLLIAVSLPTTAFANMAAPYLEADVHGEWASPLDDVVVEREELRIDLRRLEDAGDWTPHGAATVEATYHLRNDGEARVVELQFVAEGLSAELREWTDRDDEDFPQVEVKVGGEPVEISRVEMAPIPDDWRGPQYSPPLDGEDPHWVSYELRRSPRLQDAGKLEGRAMSFFFEAPLARGKNRIDVRYMATPGAQSADSPYWIYQFPYVLAPARDWGGFGTLELEVLVPEGWPAATSLATERNGDVLRGTYEGVPADTLAVTTTPPVDSFAVQLATSLPMARWVGFALLAFLAGWGVWSRREWTRLGRVGGCALAVIVVVGTAYAVGQYIADLDLVFLKDQLTTEWRYGRGWISEDQLFVEGVGAAICTALGAVIAFVRAE